MKTAILFLLTALGCLAQGTRPASVWPPCSATVTTNCTPQVSGAGALVVGNTVLALRCTGVNDYAAISAALTAAYTEIHTTGICVIGSQLTIPKGKVLTFGPGSHRIAGLLFTDSTTDNTGTGVLRGAGSSVSILTLASGSNVDVVSQVNFAALSGTSSVYGCFQCTISGLTIDGNKAGQTGVSFGIRLYGHQKTVSDVIVQNAYSDGLYSEWAATSSFTTPSDGVEDSVNDLKTILSGGNGVTWRGPHDSRLVDFIAWGNGGWGIAVQQSAGVYNGSGLSVANINTFLNTSGGCYSNASMSGTSMSCTTATGQGMLIDTGSGGHQLSSSVFAGPTALLVKAPGQSIMGTVENSTVSGLTIVGGGGSFNLISYNNTGYQVDWTGGPTGQGNLVMVGNGIAGTLFNGSPPSSWFTTVSLGISNYYGLPTTTLHPSNGYAPVLPASNATLVVNGDGGQTGNFYDTNVYLTGVFRSTGTKPTITGCGTIGTQTGGAISGTFQSGAVSCTPVLTGLPSTPTGFVCTISNRSLGTGVTLTNTASTTVTATFPTMVTTINDVLAFQCGISN